MILNHTIASGAIRRGLGLGPALELRDWRRGTAGKMRIGIMTGVGDCPGLNAAIRAIARRAAADSVGVLGFRNGWLGLVENDYVELTRSAVAGILPRGGTILGTSRFNPLKDPESIVRLKENWAMHQLSGLAVIGGEGTLSAARDLWRDHELQGSGHPQDNRQRHLWNGLYLWLRYGRVNRYGRRRSPALDGRIASPGDGGRSDGTA